MNCPNCGLSNPDNAKFCANCGTSFSSVPPPYQAPYQAPAAMTSGNAVMKNVGLGCLIVVAIFLFFGLSCTRACLGFRHGLSHGRRRYLLSRTVPPNIPPILRKPYVLALQTEPEA